MSESVKQDTRIVELGEMIRPDSSVVVIDVIRAFTCSVLAFAQGAQEIMCVSDLEQARDLHETNPDTLLIGEEGGLKPQGFHYGNSPKEILQGRIDGKRLVQCTSNGTRGLVNASSAHYLWAASALNATATALDVIKVGGDQVDLVVTDPSTGEDRSCANFIIDLVAGLDPDPNKLAEDIHRGFSQHRDLWRRKRTQDETSDFADDVALCALVDICDFTLAGTVMPNHLVSIQKCTDRG